MGIYFKINRIILAPWFFSLKVVSKKLFGTFTEKQANFVSHSSNRWGKKIILLLASLVISIPSLSVQANAEPTKSNKVVVKKYSVGKPGYNRHVVKKYKKDITNSATNSQSSSRQRMMKFRNHP